jgi:hypothetical protein
MRKKGGAPKAREEGVIRGWREWGKTNEEGGGGWERKGWGGGEGGRGKEREGEKKERGRIR